MSKKQACLIMIVDVENRHYTTIKTISRHLPKLKAKSNSVYHFCTNCLDCFSEASTIDKHYEYYNSNVHVKVNMSFEKEKLRKF